jgi:hypothetical protein
LVVPAPHLQTRCLTSHFGWHGRSSSVIGLRRSGWRRSVDHDRRSLRELGQNQADPGKAQLSYPAWRSEAEPHWCLQLTVSSAVVSTEAHAIDSYQLLKHRLIHLGDALPESLIWDHKAQPRGLGRMLLASRGADEHLDRAAGGSSTSLLTTIAGEHGRQPGQRGGSASLRPA